jgi:hypothetical protein
MPSCANSASRLIRKGPLGNRRAATTALLRNTAGTGHDRFDFTIGLMIDGLAHR